MRALLLIVLALVSLYVATSGLLRLEADNVLDTPIPANATHQMILYKGITIDSAYLLRLEAFEKARPFCSWAFVIPISVVTLLSAVSLGFIGGVARILYHSIKSDSSAIPNR